MKELSEYKVWTTAVSEKRQEKTKLLLKSNSSVLKTDLLVLLGHRESVMTDKLKSSLYFAFNWAQNKKAWHLNLDF